MSQLQAFRQKTTAELLYIHRDAYEAAQAMRGVSEKAEAKYLDQLNDACTVLYERKQKELGK